jgi:hypothetical protein
VAQEPFGIRRRGGEKVRLAGRVIVALLSLAAFAAAVYGSGMAARWLESRQLLDRRPDQPVSIASLGQYTRQVAGKAWFGSYFSTMVFPSHREPGPGPTPIVAKWERSRVAVDVLDGGGPGVDTYLQQIVARLDRLQHEVRFVVSSRSPVITIRFLSHAAYARVGGANTVGNTRTDYYTTSPGLVSARISIDAGVQDKPGEVQSTLIHELTHAIGCSGHFYSPADSGRSVMFTANRLTEWSQSDAAVIRLLYSPWIRSGMSPARARASIRLFSAGHAP